MCTRSHSSRVLSFRVAHKGARWHTFSEIEDVVQMNFRILRHESRFTLTCLITEHVRLATPDFPSKLFALFATCSLSRFDFSSKMFVYCTIVHLNISKSKRFFAYLFTKIYHMFNRMGRVKLI